MSSTGQARPVGRLPFNPPFFYGWVIVAVSIVSSSVSSIASNVFTGSIVGPIISDLGWNRTELTAAVTVATVFSAAVQPVLGRMADRWGPRLLIPLGAVMFTTGALILAGMTTLWQFYLGYLLMRALGSTFMSGLVSQAAIVNWFVRMRGRTMGLSHMALPVAQSALVPLAMVVVVADSWRTVYVAVAAACVVLCVLPAAVLMRRRPEDVGLHPDGAAGPVGSAAAGHLARGRDFSFYAGEALRTRTFWLLTAGQMCAIVASGAVSFHTTLFWMERGLSPAVGAAALSAYALAGGLSSALWGLLSERFSERALGIIIQSAAVLIVGLMLVLDSPVAAVALSGLYGVSSRGEGTIFNLLLANYYGRRHFGAIMGIFNPFSSVGLGAGPFLAAAGYDLGGGYLNVWLAFMVLHTITVLCLVLMRQPPLPARARPPRTDGGRPMLLQETDDRFEVRPSTIPGAGEGLFARVPLATGDRLEAIGVLVQPGSLEDRCTAFADEYKLRVGGLLLIPLGLAGKLNHADQPNLGKVVEGERLYLQALRSVAAGEELYFSYSDYARQRFGIQ